MTKDHSRDHRDARPDDQLAQAVRSAHAASLDHLSPRVRAQLAQRRHAALAEHGRPSEPGRWPMFALGSAAALTLAIGLFALRDGSGSDTVAPSPGQVAVTPARVAVDPSPAPPTTATTPAAATEPASAVASTGTPQPAIDSIVIDDALPADLLAAGFSGADEAMGFDALQESPDFYLWLGSDSAQVHRSELL